MPGGSGPISLPVWTSSDNNRLSKVHVIDSHTGGEPTRIVMDGGPDLGSGPLSQRLVKFRDRFDWFRSGVVNEPRGSDVVVGGLLCEPVDPSCAAGIIFFNNVSYLGMCGHGTIGLLTTLAYAGRIQPGEHRVETPVGTITAVLHESGEVTVHNVASYCYRSNVAVDVPHFGVVVGDIAWGGNWFFLTHNHGIRVELDNVGALTDFAWRVREALVASNITGEHGHEIDHIDLIPFIEGKNFVLCPGKAYDRSPCGTGTSAKMACLHADGKLKEGEIWRQEGIIGSVFEGTIQVRDGKVYPSIKGSAFITAEADLIFDPRDPLRAGIRP